MMAAAVGAAAYDFESGGVFYEITSPDEVTVVSGGPFTADYVAVPAVVVNDGHSYQVTAIGDNAFRNSAALIGVQLPAGLKSIASAAFSNCPLLARVDFPDGLATIGDAAFYGCQSLYRIQLPASVTAIGSEAFARCGGLTLFTVDSENAYYSAPGGVLMDKQQTRIIAYPALLDNSYAVPAGVVEIADGAFLGCRRLLSVSLPEGLTTIGNAAFHGCSALQTLNWPQSLQQIGVWAFSECAALPQVQLGADVAVVGEGAFSFCSQLQAIRVAADNAHYASVDGVLLTKDQRTLVAVPGGKTGSYRIPATVETVGNQAFFGCDQLVSVTLTAALSDLGENPFVFCDNLTDILVSGDHPDYSSHSGVLLNKDQTAIVFYPNGKRGAYTVPLGITSLQSGPFLRSHQLTSLTIPYGVETIGNWTFMDCEGLQSVSLPSTLISIGDRAFACPSLQTVVCAAQPMATTAFAANNFSQTTLYVPVGRADAFYQTDGWNAFGSCQPFGIQIPEQTVPSGNTARLALQTVGPFHLSQLEADVVLPPVFTLQAATGGAAAVQLADQVDGSVTCTQLSAGRYHLKLQCTDQRVLDDATTDLLYLTVNCQPDTQEGVYDMLLQSADFGYTNAVLWGQAGQPDAVAGIQVVDAAGINNVTSDGDGTDRYYNLNGQRVQQPGKGVYIVRGKKVLLSR